MLRHAVLPLPKPVRVLKQKKRKKKTSRMLLEKKADILTREIVLDRDGYCVCPAPKKGHGSIYQCGHLVSRAKKAVRFDLLNCSTQCQSCNFLHEHYPHFYTSWFIREFGIEQYQRLIDDSEEVVKLSEEDLEEICNQLTAIRRRQLDCLRDSIKYKPRYTQKQIASGEWRNERDLSTSLPELQGVPSISSQQGWR